MRRLSAALVAAGFIVSMAAGATEQSGHDWTTPAITGYGRIHDLPHAAYRPAPDRTYRVVFALTQPSRSPGEVNAALDHVARAVNLYVAAGVPLDRLKFVAVVAGAATPLTLDDEHYRTAYGTANPNLALIAKLRAAGVDVAVCAQALAEHSYAYGWVDPHVTLALSALTTITVLGNQGYAVVQM